MGEEDFGFGPARSLDPARVAASAAALEAVDFSSKIDDYRRLVLGQSGVYPGYDDEEGFNYVEYYFLGLREFFSRVAAEGSHLILCIA